MKKGIIISEHPDDEILRASDPLLKCATNGDKIFWPIATGVSEAYGFSKVFQEVRPEEIYSLNRGGVHSDHRHPFDVGTTCVKSFRYSSVKQVLLYQFISND